VLKSALGATIWTVDNVESPSSTANTIVTVPLGTQTITQPAATNFNFVTSVGGKLTYNGVEVATVSGISGAAVLKAPTASQAITQPSGTTLSVNSLRNFLDAGQFTGGSTAAQVLAAQTACGVGTLGCYIDITPGNPAGALPATSSMGANTIIDEERYVNSASPFNAFLIGTHAFHEYTQSVGPLQSWETANPYTGPSIIALTANANTDGGLPSPTTQGEMIPFMANVERNTGSNRFIEGADINIGVQTLTNDANGLEIDCNNLTTTDDTNEHMHCLQLIGGSSAHPGTALQITALGSSTSSWLTGIDLTRYHDVGMNIDSGDTVTMADIQIHPPDDTTADVIRQYNNARSQIVYELKRNGDVTGHTILANSSLQSNTTAGFNRTISNGSAWQTFTGAIGCTTAASVGATCSSPNIPLSVLFPSTNYALVCTIDTPTGVPVVSSVVKGTATFNITIAALTGSAATGNYNCTAIMHP
jgi:hypothetical protein